MQRYSNNCQSLDRLLEALSDANRRALLFALRDGRPGDDASVRVDSSWDEVDGGAALTAMRHNHLPRLEETGIVRWNRETHRVVEGPRFRELEPLLETLEDYR